MEDNNSSDKVEIIDNVSSRYWQQFKELRLGAIQENPAFVGLTFDFEEERTQDFYQNALNGSWNGSTCWLVFARNNNKRDFIAMAGALQLNGNIPTRNHVAEIISFYIKPEFRKTNVPQQVMQALFDKLKKTEITQTQVWVNQDDKETIWSHEKSGFNICGSFKNDVVVDGISYNSVTMEKHIEKD